MKRALFNLLSYLGLIPGHHSLARESVGTMFPEGVSSKKMVSTWTPHGEAKKESEGGMKKKETNPKDPTMEPKNPVESMLDREDKDMILEYIRSLSLAYEPFLKKNVGLHTRAVPYNDGVVIQITYKPHEGDNVVIEPKIKSNVGEVFRELNFDTNIFTAKEKELYQQSLKNKEQVFSGTGVFCFDDKFYLIKDFYETEWSEKTARKDSKRIVSLYKN